jgi:hypothetical protein
MLVSIGGALGLGIENLNKNRNKNEMLEVKSRGCSEMLRPSSSLPVG